MNNESYEKNFSIMVCGSGHDMVLKHTTQYIYDFIIDFVCDENPTGVQSTCVCVCCSKSSEVVGAFQQNMGYG